MVDKSQMRDTVAELTERAQLISQDAGGKVAAAMKDVISAGAGIAGFALESARDLVQFMVRRGQMSVEEGDRLIREAEAIHGKRPANAKVRPPTPKPTAAKSVAKEPAKPVTKQVPKSAAKPAAKKSAAKAPPKATRTSKTARPDKPAPRKKKK